MILMNDIEATIKKYGYINFEPANEKWSVYCLKDKTIIKLKVIPLKFFKKDDKKTYPKINFKSFDVDFKAIEIVEENI